MTYICVELPDEGGEVAVLEVLGQEVPGELGRAPDDEAVVPGAPGHDVVRGRVVNHLVGLHEEGRRRRGGRPAVAHRGVRGRGRRGRGRGHWRRHRRGHRSRGRTPPLPLNSPARRASTLRLRLVGNGVRKGRKDLKKIFSLIMNQNWISKVALFMLS